MLNAQPCFQIYASQAKFFSTAMPEMKQGDKKDALYDVLDQMQSLSSLESSENIDLSKTLEMMATVTSSGMDQNQFKQYHPLIQELVVYFNKFARQEQAEKGQLSKEDVMSALNYGASHGIHDHDFWALVSSEVNSLMPHLNFDELSEVLTCLKHVGLLSNKTA